MKCLIHPKGLIVAVDSAAYRRFQVVPFNIILYNVFSGKDRGPNIFGTEPWWYYVVNLILYFNVVAIAAWCSFPLLVFPICYPEQSLIRIIDSQACFSEQSAPTSSTKLSDAPLRISVDWHIYCSASQRRKIHVRHLPSAMLQCGSRD